MIGHGECFRSLTLKEVLGMSRGFTTRHAKTSRDKIFLFKSGSHILGSNSPQNNNSWGNSIPCEWPTHYWLRTTSVPALTVTLHWCRSCTGTAVERRSQGTALGIRPKIMARHVEAAAYILNIFLFSLPTRGISLLPPPCGAEWTLPGRPPPPPWKKPCFCHPQSDQ